MPKNRLKTIKGEKLRWQFFNFPIYALIYIFLICVVMFMTVRLADGSFTFLKWVKEIAVSVEVVTAFMLPFLLLSVLNKFLFGRIICVLNDEGIHYKDGIIRWNEIIKIEYEIQLCGNVKPRFSYARIITENGNIELVHVPHSFLNKVKKYDRDIEAYTTKNSKILVLLFLLPIVICAVYPFIV